MSTHTVKETAAAIRAHLRREFPGTKFSVRMAPGTAYGWIDVAWTNGPTDARVREITAAYESRRFSGMDDSYHATGVTEWTCCGVITQRSFTPARRDWALGLVRHDDDRPAWDTDAYSIKSADLFVTGPYPELVATRFLLRCDLEGAA